MDPDDLSTRGLLKRIYRSTRRQEAFLSELSASFSRLSSALEGMRSDYESRLTTVQEALDAERAQDVNDAQALADAQAQTNQALADAQQVSEQMNALADQLTQAQSQDPGQGSGGEPTPSEPGAPDDSGTPSAPDTGGGDQPAPVTDPVDTGALPADDSGDVAVAVDDSQALTTDQNEGPAADMNPEDETTV
jgi:hypothetical protein